MLKLKLDNLKINFLGDSITEGVGATSTDKCYVSLVANQVAISRNYGIGGTRIARQINMTQELFDKDFCMRYDSMDDDADVVVVFGGTNDFGHGDAPIGDFSDDTPKTFYGALHYLFRGLKEKYPKAFIFIITPLHRATEASLRGDGKKLFDMYPLITYINAIREVAEYYSLDILDLFEDKELTYDNLSKYFPDGLHPNDLGHKILSERIIEFIEKQ